MKKILLILSVILSFNIYAEGMMAHDPYVRLLPPTAKNTGAFMNLMNHGDKDMKLVKAESNVATKVEVHNHVKVDGMMRMREVKEIEIKKHKMVELMPGGYHIMLMDLKEPLKEGQIIDIKLIFADGQTLKVKAPVKQVKASKKMKHHHH